MLITESIHHVDSDASSDFRNKINASGASQYADIALAAGTPSTVGPNKCVINSVRLLAIQDLDWQVQFHSKSYGSAVGVAATQFSDVNGSHLVGWSNHLATTTNIPANWTDAHTTTATIYGSTTYASYISGLNIPYEDRDGTGRLHVNLVNKSATAKNPGDTGLIHLRVGVIYAS